ncbi:putative tail protein [Oceanicella actignis]|nr:glycoside hydrolase TIM-barrel-like domain-containing protein [Oceanicella actignis]TYO91415.1 putative tail protein [Oceanicella actignis]
MATVILGAAGAAIGGAIGGSILGVGGATIGAFVGASIGSAIDTYIISSVLAPSQRVEGARLDQLTLTSSTEGAVIPRVYGRMRIGGNVIWATDFREERKTSTEGGGKGGGGGKVTTTEYLYYASFAVALCEGPIAGIGRIWADGKPLDMTGVTWRWYPGDEAQEPDPFIAGKMGADGTPAYRGTAYVVIEDLPLANFGNRLPQISFEVFAPLADPDTLEGLVKTVTMIPASGEWVYGTTAVRKGARGAQTAENLNADNDKTDMVVSLDRLEASAPHVEMVNVAVAWFGDDLRAAECRLRPGVDDAAKTTTPLTWEVNGVTRATAHAVSQDSYGRAAYGGTPADVAVLEAIREMKARGLRVGFYPFIQMDIPSGNGLPNPWQGSQDFVYLGDGFGFGTNGIILAGAQDDLFSANHQNPNPINGDWWDWDTIGVEEAVIVRDFDLRALGISAAQVDAGLVQVSVAGTAGNFFLNWGTPYLDVFGIPEAAGGGKDFQASVLAGGVWANPFAGNPDSFSLTRTIPPGSRWIRLQFRADVAAIAVNLTQLTIGQVDLRERETSQPAHPWRGRITVDPAPGLPGTADKTADAATQIAAFFGAATPADFAVSGDEVTWTGDPTEQSYRRMVLHYAHLCAAAGGVDTFLIGSELRGLTSVRDDTGAYPAVQQLISLAADVRAILGPDVEISYAADWSEYFGHHPQDGSGDVIFNLDPLWADANIDFVGIDYYAPLSDWRDGFEHADAAEGWPSIYDRGYLQAQIEGGEGYDWFYASEDDRAAQIRTPITDGAAGKPWVFRFKDLRSWWSNPHYDRPGGVESSTPTAWTPESKPIRFTEIGCPAIDRGSNQPNVFFDAKSSESALPWFSRGWRDDAIQRAYLEAAYLYWSDPSRNPTSSVYAGPMVDIAGSAAWTWDARPYPWFPALTDVWADGENWRRGHWLTGRLGAASLAALVRDICARAGLPEDRIDVSGLWGAVDGHVIAALESPRASITTLARHFGFDAVESEGVIRFVMRGRGPVAGVAPDDLVTAREGDVLELTRGQETELPQALKWQVARADEDYEAAQVEARRITVDSSRVTSETFPMAAPPEEAERRCRRALIEAWAGREGAVFRLPPSRLALDPADVVTLDHDGRATPMRIVSVADADARAVEAVRQDREAYDLPPGGSRASALARMAVFGAPEVVFLDLPQLTDDAPAHRPRIAAFSVPWPGEMAVFRSPSTDGFELLTALGAQARIGTLVTDFHAGPTSRFDHGNEMIVDLLTGTLESVTDIALFGGANAIAVESAPGAWEIVQAGEAELLAPGRYRLTRLLRGQRGTEWAMGDPTPAGARVVVLDEAVPSLPVSEADLGIPWNWRIGPATRPVSDDSYVAAEFTPDGVGLRPFSPAHVEQPWRRPRTPGDLTISWIRRSRALAADNWRPADVPLGEDSEAYEVEILDGATVKRVLSSTTTSVLYAEADQVADWGAPLGPGDSLAVRIYQISEAVGRGAPADFVLSF